MTLPVTIRLLPDGSGRVRIHWYVKFKGGPIKSVAQNGVINFPASEGKIACSPDLGPSVRLSDGSMQLTHRSDDPRAVTCPECMATQEFKDAMAEIGAAVPVSTAEDVYKAAPRSEKV